MVAGSMTVTESETLHRDRVRQHIIEITPVGPEADDEQVLRREIDLHPCGAALHPVLDQPALAVGLSPQGLVRLPVEAPVKLQERMGAGELHRLRAVSAPRIATFRRFDHCSIMPSKLADNAAWAARK